MKKIISATPALILAFTLCACSGGGNGSNETTNGTANNTSNNMPGSTPNDTSVSEPAPASEPASQTIAENADNTNTDDQAADEDDLPYWNGFDFGVNLEYIEEYEIMGDPGEYMNAAEAAKYTFDIARDNDNIPEYNDSTEYTMVLVDLDEDIGGEECYVYRLDIDEPAGTLGAAYACAYQSGNIYMQGYGGQYILIAADDSYDLTGDDDWSDPGDTDLPHWWGEYKSDMWSVGITNLNVNSLNDTYFHFTFYNLRNGQEFYNGVAAVDPDNALRAEYGEIDFWLSDDFSSVTIFVTEGSQWEHLSGYYEQI